MRTDYGDQSQTIRRLISSNTLMLNFCFARVFRDMRTRLNYSFRKTSDLILGP